jgi:glucosamine--fructose-6-phosphate aminotransferase (isomerizing)
VAKRHINVVVGSEFPSYRDFLKEKSLVIAVSQSGETADTLEAIEVAKKKGSKVLSIVNVEGSTMDRESDYSLHINAGPEKAVASTKATTSQIAILTLLSFACCDQLQKGKTLLIDTAGKINDMLNPRYEEHILKLAKKIKDFESMYVIGKAVNYAMALEAAIKLQEVSYIHAEGFAGGELKHGPIALISEGTPCIVLVANDDTKVDILNNAREIKARGGFIIGISPEPDNLFDYWIRVPDVGIASPIVNIIPIQLLAYHLAVIRKNNPDMPRNLAKSVTVK